MSDVNANIGVNIDSSQALAQLKALQRQISEFHNSVAKSSEAAALAQKSLQKNLVSSVNSIGAFSAELRTVNTTAESFTKSLENNKLSMREYFRYAGAATKTFGQSFKSEFDTIGKVAEERVKTLQTQYIKMGRDANGAMKAIAVRPLMLDMNDLSTKTQIAAQKQAIFNQLMKQGSTNLLNFGKNTQWAGRQLMVGFTLPLAAFGATAAKAFQQLETEVIRFRKVYGDLGTSKSDTDAALANIQSLADGYTKYGVEVAKTVGVASQAAAAGFQGADLIAQTDAATKLSILGQIEQQQALETTISLQNAFKISSTELATTIDFLNAVENQTVTSLDDITTAIPKVAPVIQQLGGDVKDLAFFLTAMKEGGINAAEGANALKSGLASLINPTNKATALLASMGINIENIVTKNKGNLKATVVEFAKALDTLDPLARARAIETMFGKFQFARISTLLSNVTQTGNQAARVLDLAGESAANLAGLTTKELGITAESALVKFQGALAKLRSSLAPVGEVFMQAFVPVLDFVSGLLDKFNGLSDGTKKFVAITVGVIGGLGPVLLMTFGLLANGIANILKLFMTLRTGFQRLTGQSQNLGEQTQYLTMEQLDAAAAAHSLEQSHARLTQQFTAEASEVNQLRIAYQQALAAGASFASMNPGMMRTPKKFAMGGIFKGPGTGTSDSIPAMVSNGEAIIPAKTVSKYPGLVNGLVAGNIPGFAKGRKSIEERSANVPIYGDMALFIQDRIENQSQGASVPGLANILAPLVSRVGEARGLGFGQQAQQQYPGIIEQYTPIVDNFINVLKTEMEKTKSTIVNADERLSRAWQTAGKAVETSLSSVKTEAERGAIKQALGIAPDSYGSIAGNFRSTHGWGGRTGRYEEGTTPTSYTSSKYRAGTSRAYELITGSKIDPKTQDYGHAFSVKARQALGLPTTVPLDSLRNGQEAISKSTLSMINNSIATASAKLQAAVNKEIVALQAAGAKLGSAVTTGVARGAKTASASKATRQTGKDIIEGLRMELAAGEPQVAIVGGKVGTLAVNSIDTAATKKPGIFARLRGLKNRNVVEGVQGSRGMISGRGMMAGAGMMAGSMALAALPEFTGKAMVQSSMNMASMGSMFGGWGMAAGAAVGLVTSGLSTLIKKEQEHAAVVKSTFSKSTEDVKFFGDKVFDATLKLKGLETSVVGLTDKFGNANPEIKSFVDYVNGLDEKDPTKVFVENLKSLDAVSSITGNIRSKVSTAIATGGLDPANAKQYVLGLLTAADQADKFAQVWKGMSKSVQDENTATSASLNKLMSAIKESALDNPGESMYGYNQATGEAIIKSYDDLSDAAQAAADGISSLAGVISSGQLSYEQLQVRLEGIRNSAMNGAMGIDLLSVAISKTGDQKLIDRFQNIKTGLKGIGDEALITTENIMKLMLLQNMDIGNKDIIKWALSPEGKKAGIAFEDLQSKKGMTDAQIKGQWAGIALKYAGSSTFKKEVEKLNEITQTPGREGVAGTTKLNAAQEKYLKILQAQIDALKEKADAEKAVNDETQRNIDLQNKQQDLANKIATAKMSGNYIEAANLQQEMSYNRAQFNQETKRLSDLEKIAVLEKRLKAIEGGASLTSAESKKIKKASGGHITGPGSGTSDSIPAYLSNGEYVIRAAAVNQYGKPFFDNLNAQRFADGGSVKDGWLQKWAKNISGQPAAEMFGTAPLLRLIAGIGGKGDKLGAAQVPLSFLGSGIGPKIAGNLGKTAFALPNKLYQLRNQAKVNSMIKSGMYHGSQPLGMHGEDYLQGTNILEGAEAYDPYYGMGFFGTSSKSEANLYASGYNSENNWGESFGSLNRIVGAPKGKYVDFTKGTNSLKWQDYSLAKALGVKKNGYLGNFMPENLGDMMSAEGISGSIMNRVNAGRTTQDIQNAKWLAWSNPAGVVTKETFANGGIVPKFHNWNGVVPGQYGQELNAVLKSGTEGVYQNSYIAGLKNNNASSSTSNSNSVYNIDMTINGGSSNANEIADQVMKKLKVISSQNNRTNKVAM